MKIAIEKNARILALFAIVCTAVVGITFELTKTRIASQEQRELLKTLHAIVPDNSHDNDMSTYCVIVNDPLLGANEQQLAYLATLANKPVAAAIQTIAPDGYNGKIHLIVAMNYNGSVSGVRTIEHKETPGLGDKIEERKSSWITNFAGKTEEQLLGSRWAVKKDGGMFDQFTGATITPRAVVKAVAKTAEFFRKHKAQLFNQENICGVTDEN